MQSILPAGIAVVVIMGFPTLAAAQTFVVQQPVVQHFGVRTVISVPDHGSSLLGSVTSAQTLGGARHPALPATQQIRSATHSSANVSAHIHDFVAMDQAVLQAAGVETSAPSMSKRSEMSAHARDVLLKRHTVAKRSWPGYATEGSSDRRWGSRTLP